MKRISSILALSAVAAFALTSCVQQEFAPITEPAMLMSPAYETITTDEMVLFEWTTVPNGASYEVVGKADWETEWTALTPRLPWSGGSTMSVLAKVPYSGYAPREWYLWNVRAITAGGIQSFPSNASRILVVLAAPRITTPGGVGGGGAGGTGDPVGSGGAVCIDNQVLKWTSVPGAEKYIIEVFEEGSATLAFLRTEVDIQPDAADPAMPAAVQSFTMPAGKQLLAYATYHWTVTPAFSGVSASGETVLKKGLGSVSGQFTVHDYILPPAGLDASPVDTFGPLPVKFTWSLTTPDLGYEFELRKDSQTGELLMQATTPPGVSQVERSLGPASKTDYFWRVRALTNVPCQPNQWSPWETFYVDSCGVPIVPVFGTDVVCPGGVAEITWDAEPGLQYVPEFSYDGIQWFEVERELHGTVTVSDSGGGTLVGTATLNAPFGGAEEILDYGWDGTPEAIPNAVLRKFGIYSNVNCTVVDVKSRLRIDHTWDGDLVISLKSPMGTSVKLVDQRGAASDNFGRTEGGVIQYTEFDSQCADNPIESGSAPFVGCFSPEESFFTFRGERGLGYWVMEVYDANEGDTGVMINWGLTINCRSPKLPSPANWRMKVKNFCDESITGDPVLQDEVKVINPELDLDSQIGGNCQLGFTLLFTAGPGYTYTVELFDPEVGDWVQIDLATECSLASASLYQCAKQITAGKGTGYQWRVTGTAPNGCNTDVIYSDAGRSKCDRNNLPPGIAREAITATGVGGNKRLLWDLAENTEGRSYFFPTSSIPQSADIVSAIITCSAGWFADIHTMVDSTGSMGGTINAVKTAMGNILNLMNQAPGIQLAFGHFRDFYDSYSSRCDNPWYWSSQLSRDGATLTSFVNSITASGGCDYPEAYFDATWKTAEELNWRTGACVARYQILYGDAPPQVGAGLTDHEYDAVLAKLKEKEITYISVFVSYITS
jgi:subtilisin-like proprotein convertase family protein